MVKTALASGAGAGIFLGLFLKAAETLTGKKVYVLLLNIDFIPVLGDIRWSGASEFFFHLLFSLLLSFCLMLILQAGKCPTLRGCFIWSFAITFPALLLYFPLSLLAERQVPLPGDMMAFGLWTAGHILYSIVLASFFWLGIRKTRLP
ncbi:hypothetical protein LCM00_16100 [Bacillus infantis]|uniref:hypothetical protein n=1 Tax=Bacillus infantis TaxID=324767 RepID=UPI001CD69D1D|nr:hypothetical protein [Bacillus infantis]MCA1041039.1 hypothetical protein [Bacillus infantis]